MAGFFTDDGSPVTTPPNRSSTCTRGTSWPVGIGMGSGSHWSLIRELIVVAVCAV